MGIDLRGRTMAALERTNDQSSPVQTELLASVYLGFGFY